MSRLIDADALIEKLESDREYFERMKDTVFAIATIGMINDIKKAPTIKTKQIKYFDEDESVWKIGEVIIR